MSPIQLLAFIGRLEETGKLREHPCGHREKMRKSTQAVIECWDWTGNLQCLESCSWMCDATACDLAACGVVIWRVYNITSKPKWSTSCWSSFTTLSARNCPLFVTKQSRFIFTTLINKELALCLSLWERKQTIASNYNRRTGLPAAFLQKTIITSSVKKRCSDYFFFAFSFFFWTRWLVNK